VAWPRDGWLGRPPHKLPIGPHLLHHPPAAHQQLKQTLTGAHQHPPDTPLFSKAGGCAVVLHALTTLIFCSLLSAHHALCFVVVSSPPPISRLHGPTCRRGLACKVICLPFPPTRRQAAASPPKLLVEYQGDPSRFPMCAVLNTHEPELLSRRKGHEDRGGGGGRLDHPTRRADRGRRRLPDAAAQARTFRHEAREGLTFQPIRAAPPSPPFDIPVRHELCGPRAVFPFFFRLRLLLQNV